MFEFLSSLLLFWFSDGTANSAPSQTVEQGCAAPSCDWTTPVENESTVDFALRFTRARLNDDTLLLHSIPYERVIRSLQQTIPYRQIVQLQTGSGYPIQAFQTTAEVLHFLNVTEMHLNLMTQKNAHSATLTPVNVQLQITESFENRRCVTSFIAPNYRLPHWQHSEVCTENSNEKQSEETTDSDYDSGVCLEPESEGSQRGFGGRQLVRVLTANVWNYNHWLLRVPMWRTLFKEVRPSVVGFQEVRVRVRYAVPGHYGAADAQLRHSFQMCDISSQLLVDTTTAEDQCEETESEDAFSAWQWHSEVAMVFSEETPEQLPKHFAAEGLALASRMPIVGTHSLALHRDAADDLDFHQRLLVGVTVNVTVAHSHAAANRGEDVDVCAANSQLTDDASANGWLLLDVFTTHLSLSENARNRTLPQIGKYIEAMRKQSVSDSVVRHSVLMGDFNCEFDRIGFHNGEAVLNEYGLFDAYKVINGEKKTASAEAHTFNNWNMSKRIDYVFVSDSLLENGHLKDARMVGSDSKLHIPKLRSVGGVPQEEMRDTLFASDHLFVFVDLLF